MLKHHSTFLPPAVYGKLKAAAGVHRTGGINGAVQLILAGLDPASLALRAVRGLPAIEPYLEDDWIRTPLTLEEETLKAIGKATLKSGVQKMFVVGVLLVSLESELAERIQRQKEQGGNDGKEVEGRGVAAVAG